eukprot:11009431-Alexandrium_andersonii.AAC.1
MSPLTWGMRWKRRWKSSAGSLGPTQINVRGLTMAAKTLLRLIGHPCCSGLVTMVMTNPPPEPLVKRSCAGYLGVHSTNARSSR